MKMPYCKTHGFVNEESCYAHIQKNPDCEMKYCEKQAAQEGGKS